MRKLTAPPNVELLGTMSMVFVQNLQSNETLPVFKKYGLVDLDPMQWYPTYKFMDAMNELADHGNLSSNMVAIGLEVGKVAPILPDVEKPNLGDVLMAWDGSYKAVHRGHQGDIGSIVCEKVDDTHYKTIQDDLYPDDFSYGIAYGFARRFLPAGTPFKVYFDPDLPQRDNEGADHTVMHIKWG